LAGPTAEESIARDEESVYSLAPKSGRTRRLI
jgi:hypothetical protein